MPRMLSRISADLQRMGRSKGLLPAHKDYKRFLILGKGRSGSNFLATSLASHPSVMAFGELFSDGGKRRDSIHWRCPGYYSTDEAVAQRRNKPIEFIDQTVFGEVSTKISAVGFKLFYHQARDDDWQGVWDHLKAMDLRVIHLRRRNYLESLVSLLIAERSKQWSNKATGDARSQERITIDYDEAKKYFEAVRSQHQAFDQYFDQTLDIWYEDMLSDFESTLSNVQNFLGVAPRSLSTMLKKQSRGHVSSRIENFEPLAKQFAGSEWETLFE